MRFHLNGLCTQARLVSAQRLLIAGPCHLCGGAVDSAVHLLECPITRQAEARLQAAAHMPDALWSVSDLFFQQDRDGAEKAFGVALFAAVWFMLLCDFYRCASLAAVWFLPLCVFTKIPYTEAFFREICI